MKKLRGYSILFIIVLISCAPVPPRVSDGLPTATLDWGVRTLPPTWTSQPTMTSNPPIHSESTTTHSPYPLTVTPSPYPVTATPFLEPALPFTSFQMASPQVGWAWGWSKEEGSTQIWHTIDGGLNWQNVSPPPEVWSFNFALDADTAWASVCQPEGEDCLVGITRTTDGGETWSVFNTYPWRNADRLKFYNELEGILSGCGAAAGTGICNIYETLDSGYSWIPMEFVTDHHGVPGDYPGQIHFCNICGDAIYFDLDRLMIVGGNMAQFADEAFPLWITLDRGQTWHHQELPLPTGTYNPGLIDPYTPIFFGDLDGILPVKLANEDYDQFAMAFYNTKDGGLSWHFRSLVDNVEYVDSWSRMDFISNQDIIFACDLDLCVSHDGAQSWQRLTPNLNFGYAGGQHYVQQFDFVDPLLGWALVGVDRYELTLWQTTNGGETWKILAPLFLEE